MGVSEASALHSKLPTAIRCERLLGRGEYGRFWALKGFELPNTMTQLCESQRLPFAYPQLCIHAQNGRKCQYVGNCSFAHSPEERDMWTFMKENKSK